jgi:hypothetical protein
MMVGGMMRALVCVVRFCGDEWRGKAEVSVSVSGHLEFARVRTCASDGVKQRAIQV